MRRAASIIRMTVSVQSWFREESIMVKWALGFVVTKKLSIRRAAMLHYAVVFFVIAIIAAVFGFTGIAAGAAEIAKILFYIFLVVFVVTLLLGVLRT
jgi:uncharacterized membrane protein YtjA (UPF0391 family)